MAEEETMKIRHIKPEIRVLGIDDGDFVPHTRSLVDVVGVVFRGGYWLEGVMRTEVEVDGVDATERIAAMIAGSPHYGQLRVVMLDGITFAGFNVVDIRELFRRVGLPVIAVARAKPNLEQVRRALENLPEKEKRWAAIENAGEIVEVRTRKAKVVYMQTAGVSKRSAEEIVRRTSTRSSVPEALRVAHMVASGLAKSKSKQKV